MPVKLGFMTEVTGTQPDGQQVVIGRRLDIPRAPNDYRALIWSIYADGEVYPFRIEDISGASLSGARSVVYSRRGNGEGPYAEFQRAVLQESPETLLHSFAYAAMYAPPVETPRNVRVIRAVKACLARLFSPP